MYFYIDESGNSGNNLFDENQPILYYATMATPFDLQKELSLQKDIEKIRKKFNMPRLHANELGYEKLNEISSFLKEILINYNIEIRFSFIVKQEYIVIKFFDQVFDSGVNDSVTYEWYWTGLRHLLVLKIAELFHITKQNNSQILKNTWQALTEQNDKTANSLLIEVCNALLSNLNKIHDKRAKEIITKSLEWAKNNPDEILINGTAKKNKNGEKQLFLDKQISPNLVGFQLVLLQISEILQNNNAVAKSIVVDSQSEFNTSQEVLRNWYQATNQHNLDMPTEIEQINNCPIHVFYQHKEKLAYTPEIKLDFQLSRDSIGLELIDLYLWIFKRYTDNKFIPNELIEIIEIILNKSNNPYSGVSFGATQMCLEEFIYELDKAGY